MLTSLSLLRLALVMKVVTGQWKAVNNGQSLDRFASRFPRSCAKHVIYNNRVYSQVEGEGWERLAYLTCKVGGGSACAYRDESAEDKTPVCFPETGSEQCCVIDVNTPSGREGPLTPGLTKCGSAAPYDYSHDGPQGPDNWARIFNQSECSGKHQSPIDIKTTANVEKDYEEASISLTGSKQGFRGLLCDNGEILKLKLSNPHHYTFRGTHFDKAQPYGLNNIDWHFKAAGTADKGGQNVTAEVAGGDDEIKTEDPSSQDNNTTEDPGSQDNNTSEDPGSQGNSTSEDPGSQDKNTTKDPDSKGGQNSTKTSGGSEHTMDGEQMDMEMQMIFFDKRNLDFSTALNKYKQVAAVSILYKVSEQPNPYLQKLIYALTNHSLNDGKEHNVGKLFNPSLFAKGQADYHYYQGSLTSPPTCKEGVMWTVMRNPEPISKEQLKVFQDLKGKKGKSLAGNFRETQNNPVEVSRVGPPGQKDAKKPGKDENPDAKNDS